MRSAITVLSMIILAVVFTSFSFEVRADEDLTFGTWTLGNPAPGHLLAVHSTLLRNGKILVVGGSSYNEALPGDTKRRASTKSPVVPGARR